MLAQFLSALIPVSIMIACVFRGHPDIDFGLSRTTISVSSGQ